MSNIKFLYQSIYESDSKVIDFNTPSELESFLNAKAKIINNFMFNAIPNDLFLVKIKNVFLIKHKNKLLTLIKNGFEGEIKPINVSEKIYNTR